MDIFKCIIFLFTSGGCHVDVDISIYHEGSEGPAQDVRLRDQCPYLQNHIASPELWTLFSVFFVHVLSLL